MKLGTQTGSLVNHIHSIAVVGQPKPEVGMGVTILMWTDRKPGTVIDVNAVGDKIMVREDKAVRADSNGMSESQQWDITEDPAGALRWFNRDDKGFWHEMVVNQRTGRLNRVKGGNGLRLGVRERYYDFSF